jgi:hypothetical protein
MQQYRKSRLVTTVTLGGGRHHSLSSRTIMHQACRKRQTGATTVELHLDRLTNVALL